MMMAMRALRALFVAVAVIAGVGCGGDTSTPGPVTPVLPHGTYDIRGSIVSVDRARNIVQIDGPSCAA